jgi:hypothetical protein
MRDLMHTTAGITEPRLTSEPLGTEGEMTGGPNDYVPFDDPEWEDDTPPEPELFSLPEELLW